MTDPAKSLPGLDRVSQDAARHSLDCVFLFGSFAQGRAHAGSDIDLGVVLDRAVPEASYLEKRLQLLTEWDAYFDQEIDVVILNDAGPVLIHQVLRYGRLVYERDHGRTTSFKARAMIDYVDWLPYKNLLDKAVLKHFGSRG